MAIPNPAYWYVSSVGYAAVTKWASATNYVVGNIVQPLTAQSVGNERVYICTTAGLSVTEPTWTFTKGSLQSGTVEKFTECTGQAALNGSLTYTSGWTSGPGGVGTGVKNQAVALGYIIARDSGASYQICTTAGTCGNGAEPSFSNTAGTTTADNTVTWTSLGVVGNFTTAFGAPFARLMSSWAANWAAAGDTIFIADNHAETQSTAITALACPGTVASPLNQYCVDHTKTSPATGDIITTPTASISTTGNSNISFNSGNGASYISGVIFSAGSGANQTAFTTAGAENYFNNCAIRKGGTTGNVSAITLNSCTLNNTSVQFGATGDSMRVNSVTWKNTPNAITGATIPVTLFTIAATSVSWLIGIDLSAITGTIFAASANVFKIVVSRCKLANGVVNAVAPTGYYGNIDFIQCDSGATNYFQYRQRVAGTLTQETTDVRTSGASDGTTPLSWKIATTVNCKWTFPFESFPIAIWNATVGSSVTATIEIINDGTTLNNDDIWMEVEYLGSTLTPQASFANSTKANNLASPTAIPTSTKAWTTTGITTPITQAMSVTFTPQLAGDIIVRVYVAKASKTIWVDPYVSGISPPGIMARQCIGVGPAYRNELYAGPIGQAVIAGRGAPY